MKREARPRTGREMHDGSKRFDSRILDMAENTTAKETHLEVDTLGAPQRRGSM